MKQFNLTTKSVKSLFLLLALLLGGTSPTWAQKALPYSYGFEDNNLATDGWTKAGQSNSSSSIGTSYAKTGSYGFRFYYDSNTSDSNPQCLVSPQLSINANASNIKVSFYYKTAGSYGPETFKVGYSTTDASVSSFTWDETVSTSVTAWTLYETSVSIPVGTKYIAIAYTATNKYYLYVDDINITCDINGPALSVYDGETGISSGYSYNFGLATAGTTKEFTLSNPGSEAAPVSVSHTGNFDAALSATSIPAGGSVTLTVTMPDTTGDDVITISSTSPAIASFVINVSGTIRDANKVYLDFADGNLPDGWSWVATGSHASSYPCSVSEGYISWSQYGGSSYAWAFTSPKLNFEKDELIAFETARYGSSTYYSPSITVEYSLDGTTWTAIGSAFTDDVYGTWTKRSVTIPVEGVKYIRFNGWYVHLRNIYGGELPVQPRNLAISKSGTSATLTWTTNGTETDWQVYTSTTASDIEGEITPINVSTTPSYTFTGLAVNTTHYAWVRSKLSDTPTYSDWKQISFYLGYAAATPSSVDGNGISNVTFGTGTEVVNYDTSKTPLYQDNSAQIGGVAAGTTANVDITYATGYGYGTVIWVDWNQNYEFEESEVVYTGESTSANPTTLKASFDISPSQSVGNYRMRIAGADSYFDTFIGGGAYNTAYPNVSSTYAVAQDYTLKVNEAPSLFAPTSLIKNSVSAFTATLGWTENGEATAWQIALGTTSEFDPDGVTPVEANANPFTLTGLTAETTYYAYVRAKKGGDVSDWSNKVEFTTTTSKPTDVVVAPSDNSAKFSWKANAGETAWQLVYSTDADFDKALATPVAVTTNPYTLTGLVPETTYYAYLRADLGGGEYSDWTDKLTFTPSASHVLTVNEGNGTTTNTSVPFFGSYTDVAGRGWSQFIIPASQLGTMNGGNVNKITFYTTSNITWSSDITPVFKVYLKEIDNEKFASKEFIDWATMTEIYDGEIVFDGNQLAINLATPHNYTGKNLMIGFQQTTAGGWCATSWVGTSADNEVGVQNASGATDYNWAAFLPKTTFNYETLTGPRLAVSTDALDFGEITQASTASDKQKTFTISNTGVAELTGLSVAVSGTGYSVSALPRTNITTSGDNATPIELTVTLAPTTSGSYDGTVTVSATGQPDKVITLSATYVADPIMGVFTDEQSSEAATTGQTVNFGYVESAPTYTYYIKNTGAGTLDVAVDNGGLTVAPANASIAAGEQQAFTITANVANVDATVTFTGTNHDGGAAVGTFAVTLQGTVMPLTTTFFEGFNYADGDATDTELVGWEINNDDANVKFYNGFVYYWASSTESGSIVTPKLHISGASDVLNLSAYARNLSYNNTKLAIAYSGDKTNWTELTSKGKSNLTTSAVNYEFSGIPEGNWYIKVEMSDVAVGYFYGFSTTLTPTTAISETTEPTLTAGVQDVELTYTKAAEKWGTLALPFATTTAELGTLYGTTVKAYALTDYDSGTNGLTFGTVTELIAGKPYVIYSEGAMSGAKLFTNKEITATTASNVTYSPVTFQSTYAPIAAGDMTGKWGVTPAGKIAKAGTGAYINGFRAYFDGFTSAPSLSFEDTTTGITIVKQADELDMDGKAYNLNGQRVNSATKGLYIINGRKVVIK